MRQQGRKKTIKNFMSPEARRTTPCPVCGVSQQDDPLLQLDLHHKDGDRSNNHPSNREFPCVKCHLTRHLRKDPDGRYLFDPSSSTDKNLLAQLDTREIEFEFVYGSQKYYLSPNRKVIIKLS